MELVVCGAHLRGQPLCGELRALGGQFVRAAETAPGYRVYALPGGPPARPGLVRAGDGEAIAVEVWRLPAAALGRLVATIPAPLGIGTVLVADGAGARVPLRGHAVVGAEDITAFGGWREYLAGAPA